jgi:hypothetical protein
MDLEKFEREFNKASSDLRAAVRSGQYTLGERSRLWRARGRKLPRCGIEACASSYYRDRDPFSGPLSTCPLALYDRRRVCRCVSAAPGQDRRSPASGKIREGKVASCGLRVHWISYNPRVPIRP